MVPPLEVLQVSADKGMAFAQTGSAYQRPSSVLRLYLFKPTRRQWLVQRDVRDDARHVLHVREDHGGGIAPEDDAEVQKMKNKMIAGVTTPTSGSGYGRTPRTGADPGGMLGRALASRPWRPRLSKQMYGWHSIGVVQ